ncbi:MAG: hypothetical protein MRJ96_01220 [Nitrospirales bacterium]|nr:hypothetical protein [Nitrospira sp.]MDR4500063.1 hypothetical protein [Nitrospirales bacterium]
MIRKISNIVGLCVCSMFLTHSLVIAAESSANTTESTLSVPYNGTVPKGPLTFPLYKGNGFQYFSAGVGLEERQLTYPTYPLKMILVQGARAFLSKVSLTIKQLDGPLTFEIPASHVEGPWVFVNIPTGTYLVTAEDSQQHTIEKQVSVTKGKTTVLYLRWAS